MDDLITWLRAQVDEDERLCGHVSHIWDPARVLTECAGKRLLIDHLESSIEGWHEGRHDNHDRAAAIEDLTDGLKLLAFPYVQLGRPGYREEWQPYVDD